MKKTLLFAFALLFATAMMAQNRAILLQESFDGTSIPAGWSVSGLGQTNWNISATNNAGGSANELWLYYGPQFNGTSRMVSPVIDLTGLTSVTISFKHYLDNYSGSHTLGIATTSDGGTTWNNAWTQVFSTDGGFQVNQEVNTPDVGSANFQFCIFYTGNSYNIDNWYFDDIMVFTLENLDIALTSTTLPGLTSTGDVAVTMGIMNFGVTTITSVEASYEIEGMEPVTQTFNVNVPSLTSSSVTFTTPATLSQPGDYNFVLSIITVNGQTDDYEENNTLTRTVSVPIDQVQRIPMIEHFSSSTCGPCVSVNNQMNTFCNNNPGRFTYTKYQMNWPGNGDPYYTAEGGVRRVYYGVSGVPDIYLDGDGTNNSAVNQNVFDQHAAQPGYFDMRGSFTVEGNTIHIIADVMPYFTTEARVYVSVNEKVTTGNVGTNGETSFHHVFMKMMPNGEGSTIAFKASELERLEFTQDLSGTHVEEMSDLEVSIWVQNYGSKYVYNSHFAYEYTEAHPYPVENLTFVLDNEADCYCINANWDAPALGNPVGYNVYVNNELVAENITENQYSYTGEPGQFYVVGVTALYDNDMSSVKAVAAATSGLEDLGLIIPESSNVIMDNDNPSLDLYVFNGNAGTLTPIQINSVVEGASIDGPYLNIELPTELPITLEAGEEFHFTVAPLNMGERSYASTSVNVNYDGGTISFYVEINGDLLTVTELPSTTKLFPNPANSTIRIEANSNIESVRVYNMMGALVETVSVNGYSASMNLSQYSNGVYFFNIRQSDGTISNQRVVVSH